jgi:hypothetical protein
MAGFSVIAGVFQHAVKDAWLKKLWRHRGTNTPHFLPANRGAFAAFIRPFLPREQCFLGFPRLQDGVIVVEPITALRDIARIRPGWPIVDVGPPVVQAGS